MLPAGTVAMTALLRLAGILILCLAGIWARMYATQSFDPPPLVPGSLHSPIVAMELVRSPAEVRSLLRDPMGQHNRDVMRKQIRLDWLFIGTYWLLFSLLGLVLLNCRWPGARLLGVVVVLGAFAAAQWDIFEDLGILLVLDTPVGDLNETMPANIRTASLVKWGLLSLVEAGLAFLFLAYGRKEWFPRLLTTAAGLSFAAASILGLGGLFWNRAIEWSSLALSLGLLAALLILLFAPGRFLAGIGAQGGGARWTSAPPPAESRSAPSTA